MFFIVCALSAEAKPLISVLSLRKEASSCPYETYASEDKTCALVISGMGQIAAASATTYLLTRFGFRKERDFLINFGSCAGKESGLYLINKITDRISGRSFYPDMLYDFSSCGLPLSSEKALVTCPHVVSSLEEENTLYEMEASAIFQAASRFCPPHRMLFLKYVSDSGTDDPKKITSAHLTKCAEQQTGTIQKILQKLSDASEPEIVVNEDLFSQTSLALRLSETMRCELKQLFIYAAVSGIDIQNLLRDFESQGRIPVPSKKKGKEVLDALREKLL